MTTMNLQQIQNRLEELSAEMLTLSNAMTALLSGSITRSVPVQTIDWTENIKPGDVVVCEGFTQGAPRVRLRCFTVGEHYIVDCKLTASYGIRVLRDDELEGHDASHVVFRKVFA